jgi:hypothetical protein
MAMVFWWDLVLSRSPPTAFPKQQKGGKPPEKQNRQRRRPGISRFQEEKDFGMSNFKKMFCGHGFFEEATSIQELIDRLIDQIIWLKAMKNAGIEMEGEVCNEHGVLLTDDPDVAEEFEFVPEEDFAAVWEENDSDDFEPDQSDDECQWQPHDPRPGQ